jgi:hypothetical protein
MSIHDYIEKQRARSEHERRRLAVIWTAVAFAVVLVIWVVSFREMSSPEGVEADPASASLNDLRNDFQNNFDTGKDSIQDMMQDLPGQTAPTEEAEDASSPANDANLNMDNSAPSPSDNSDSKQNKIDGPSVPQLP